ncbi:hypothetical protein GGI12_002962 [Dipsacomyces acuminosporus]|nr:hypothetical protein GGI12_002962 [Dipsacomyces acuminosporus]
MSNTDGDDSIMDASSRQQQALNPLGQGAGSDSVAGAAGGSSGNFPFPLTDQASLLNFHMPSGLGAGSLYSQMDHGLLDGIPTSAGTDGLAMDIALLDAATKSDLLAYSNALSQAYSRNTAATAASNATPASNALPELIAKGSSQQQQQQQQMPSSSAATSQNVNAPSAARVRVARARVLKNLLYSMSLGGIQQLDGYHNGYHNGNNAAPAGGFDGVSAISNSPGMNRFLADVANENAFDLPLSPEGHMPSGYQHGNPYQTISPLSRVEPMGNLNSGTLIQVQQQQQHKQHPYAKLGIQAVSSVAPSRIDQACKMCRRRKVRCDGLRPSCTFCQTKKFECIYEPVAPGSRKRSRRSKNSDSGSIISSNDTGRGHTLPSVISASGEDDNRHRRGKQRRYGDDDADMNSEGSDVENGESSANEADPEHGYLDALSNRQIALPGNVGTSFSLNTIVESRSGLELAEGAAAAALASIADDARDSGLSETIASINARDRGGDGDKPKSPIGAAVGINNDNSAKSAAPISHTEQAMQLYFEFFHPQHPILHRHTFEKAVRAGTVNKVLWLAVQAIAARYGPPPDAIDRKGKSSPQAAAADNSSEEAIPGNIAEHKNNEPTQAPAKHLKENTRETQSRLQPFEYGKRYAELVRAMLPDATRTPTVEVIQALYLLSEHQFGLGNWLDGSTYWGTAVRMFNQLQLHMTDEAFQFPAYTSHLGLHESAISPLTCKQSPANYASEMRKPTLNNESWIKRELERRMRWVLFESERMHTLAGGNPPLVTLEAGWVHMPCSDAIWEMPNPRRAAEYERLLLHMGRYYVDTGGSLRIEMAPSSSAESSQATNVVNSVHDSLESDPSDNERTKGYSSQAISSMQAKGSMDSTPEPHQANLPVSHPNSTSTANPPFTRRMSSLGVSPNRVASMLVSVRRRKNRIHLKAHTAIVVGQMTRARLALFRLFFPCRWPSQLMSSNPFGFPGTDDMDLGGGGGAPGPVVLSWEERFRRMRVTIADIESKLMQWRVYLESMFPLREHEEGSGRTDEENRAIHRERVEYANYRFMLAALIMQNRSTVLQLQACLARRERKIRHANEEPAMGEAAKQTLANHILPNQPSEAAMKSLRVYGQECWTVIVRQACEIGDLLESHWQVQPHSNSDLHVLVKPNWHAPNAIKAKINAETNLRKYPEDETTGQRQVTDDVKVFFSHETPPYPLLVPNYKLLDALIRSANITKEQTGAELALASSMNTNIHIETNANARNTDQPAIGGRQRSVRSSTSTSTSRKSSLGKRNVSGRSGPAIRTTASGEVDFESDAHGVDDGEEECSLLDPFRVQFTGTSYFIFFAAKAMIMYLHHAKMSAYILAKQKTAGSESGDTILPSSSVSVDADHNQQQEHGIDTMLLPDSVEDLSPPPQLKTLSDIRRMQDRLEIVMTALRRSQKYWMTVDYYLLCCRKIRSMSSYGPWKTEDPVSSDISAELANEAWPQHEFF